MVPRRHFQLMCLNNEYWQAECNAPPSSFVLILKSTSTSHLPPPPRGGKQKGQVRERCDGPAENKDVDEDGWGVDVPSCAYFSFYIPYRAGERIHEAFYE
ncbi:unnamed protein product [Rhizoctonia solani]|uniref:Uncharacterized protein n=1 Tax=Rhizoctonia solani TaxID=456999 RepID=A0A8H3D004_9AGAM|nr:unnamed protein product [Rhizoctonia solani]